MHLFRSPVTKIVTPGVLSASYLARWSTMAAPSLRWSSLRWSRCVFINTTLWVSSCSSCFPAAGVDGRGWKSATVARREVPAPGKYEPGLKGSRESQKVSVSRRVNAALFFDAQKMCVVKGRARWEGRPTSLTAGRRSDRTRQLICRHPCPRQPVTSRRSQEKEEKSVEWAARAMGGNECHDTRKKRTHAKSFPRSSSRSWTCLTSAS